MSGLDTGLGSLGYEGADLLAARADVVGWARTRVQAARNRTGVIAGLGITVTARGRAELRPLDRPLAGPGEVTVEVLVSALSPGTERAQWLRLPNAQPDIPYSPGYSGAGRVVAVGPEVAGMEEGRIVGIARLPHTSVATVPAAWVTPVPGGVNVADAALVYLAIIAGYGVRRGQPRAGEAVCVVGAGPIGALAQRLTMLHNPGLVTVVATSRRREEAARHGGADAFLTVAEGLEGIQAATVIEATGDPAALGTAVAAARPGATVVLLGSPRGRTPIRLLADAQRKGLSLVGAHVSALAIEAKRSGRDHFQELARTYLSALADGALGVHDLVGEAVDPREAQLAYRRLARGELRKAHFDWCRIPVAARMRRRPLVSPPLVPRDRARIRALPSARTPPGGNMGFALVGCGDVGLHNARAIAAAPNARLVACHDPVPTLAAAVAERFGGTPAASLEQAFDAAGVDAAFLCVPHDLHAPLVEEAAAAGLHVIVEKPLANSLAEAHRAVDAAARAAVQLSVCFPYRYEAPLLAARELVRGGALGELHGACVIFHTDKPQAYWVGGLSGRSPSSWRSSLERSGGGVLMMNVTHYVDFMRFLAGAEPIRVAAAGRWARGAEVEDGIAVTVEFEGGAIGTISGSASTRGMPPNRFELWGETGTLILEPHPAIVTERAVPGLPVGRWCVLPEASDEEDPRAVFVERFVDAVRAGRPVEVAASDGLAVQAFVEAAYHAAREGSKVPVAGGHQVAQSEPVDAL